MQATPEVARGGSIEKAIDVLLHLHGVGGGAGVSEVGRALDLPKSSVHRILKTLVRRGFVERDEEGRYRPGLALVPLGMGVLERDPVVSAARPVLEAGARELGETFFLVAARRGRLVVLDKVEGDGFLRASPQIGAEVPAHATAVGKLYRAFAAREVDWRDDPAAPGAREAFTKKTLVDEAAFERAAATARKRGFAQNRDEWVHGLSVLAAPVHLAGRMAGAVAVAGSSARLRSLGDAPLRDRVLAAAHEIDRRLAGQGETK